MYAQAVRTPPRFWHRGGRQIQSSAYEQCAEGCAFSDVQLDCIKYLKLGDAADGTEGQLTEDEEALLSAFRGLNREARELMLRIAGGFAGNPCMTAEEK